MAVTIKTFIDPAQLKIDVAINPGDIQNGFLYQASLFADYARLAALAEKQEADIKLLLRMAEATAAKKMRDEAVTAKVKVPSETQIDKDILLDAKVFAMRRALNEAELTTAICKGAVEAFKQRKDMLVSTGAHERQEMQGELRMGGGTTAVEAYKRSMKEKSDQAA